MNKPIKYLCGAIAQLGERVVRNDEAVGSIPTSSTKSNLKFAPEHYLSGAPFSLFFNGLCMQIGSCVKSRAYFC